MFDVPNHYQAQRQLWDANLMLFVFFCWKWNHSDLARINAIGLLCCWYGSDDKAYNLWWYQDPWIYIILSFTTSSSFWYFLLLTWYKSWGTIVLIAYICKRVPTALQDKLIGKQPLNLSGKHFVFVLEFHNFLRILFSFLFLVKKIPPFSIRRKKKKESNYVSDIETFFKRERNTYLWKYFIHDINK